MEMHQVRYFLAVAEELNFTRAAERLVLGQAGVSRTVATLEHELGVTLLERTSIASVPGTSPTPRASGCRSPTMSSCVT